MLDKRKIRLMIKMASYEKQGAEEDLKISSYYKIGPDTRRVLQAKV